MAASGQSATKIAHSVAEAAEIAGVSPNTIRVAINDKTYPYPLIARRVGAKGGKLLIEHDELVAWLKAHPAEAVAS